MFRVNQGKALATTSLHIESGQSFLASRPIEAWADLKHTCLFITALEIVDINDSLAWQVDGDYDLAISLGRKKIVGAIIQIINVIPAIISR